ncbi:MAG TPA: RHS repeat domain-containing protein [Nitrospira sp.]|nr:RHS repeat domain-containing protein [Nitrospira sp.]
MRRRFAYGYSFYVILAIAGVMALTGAVSSVKTDRERDGLFGPVRQVVTVSGETHVTRMYSRAGALLEAATRQAAPVDQPDLGERVQKTMFVYDAQGRRTREMVDEGDGPYLSRLYAYSATGTPIAEAAYHMCGTFSSLVVHDYDAAGTLRRDLSYRFRSMGEHRYTWDAQGRITARKDYQNGVLISTLRYSYDAQGRLTEQEATQADGTSLSRTAYQYDQRGNLIGEELTNFHDPSLNAKSVSSYEYDAAGNWTGQIVRRLMIPAGEDGKPMSEGTEVIRRIISYY